MHCLNHLHLLCLSHTNYHIWGVDGDQDGQKHGKFIFLLMEGGGGGECLRLLDLNLRVNSLSAVLGRVYMFATAW